MQIRTIGLTGKLPRFRSSLDRSQGLAAAKRWWWWGELHTLAKCLKGRTIITCKFENRQKEPSWGNLYQSILFVRRERVCWAAAFRLHQHPAQTFHPSGPNNFTQALPWADFGSSSKSLPQEQEDITLTPNCSLNTLLHCQGKKAANDAQKARSRVTPR